MPVVDPFLKSTCPFCFERFYLADCDIVLKRYDNSGTLIEEVEPAPKGLKYAMSRVQVKLLNGPHYASKLARRRCPHCLEHLPSEFEKSTNLVIAVEGAGHSGKSHYLTATIDQLQHRPDLGAIGRQEVLADDDVIKGTFRTYYWEPFMVHGKELPFTPEVLADKKVPYKPLVYSVVFRRKSHPYSIKRANLIFFDIAGENFATRLGHVAFAQYVFNAAALIFLVDPHAVEGIESRLPHNKRSESKGGDDPVDVLSQTIQLTRGYKGLSDKQQLNIPLVITIAKADLLKYAVGTENQHLSLLKDANYDKGFNIAEFQRVSDEVESLLRGRFGLDRLVTLANDNFWHPAYSAVSAAGRAPKDKQFELPISPRRCLDPLLWSLWRLGIIEDSA